MGRIKNEEIKRLASELMEKSKDSFGDNFEHNKMALEQMNVTSSKRIRNKVAGYITRKIRQEKKE